MTWELASVGVDAADYILESVYRMDIRKALNPLDPKDYQKLCRQISKSLQSEAVPLESAALKKAFQSLDVDWKNLPPEAQKAAISTASAYMGKPLAAQVVPKIEQKLSYYAKDIVSSTKSKSVHEYNLNISSDMNTTDERIAKFVAESNGHFIRDQFGKRSEAFGVAAKSIVETGLSRGLGTDDIAERLHDMLGVVTGKSPGYWTMISMVFANRARTLTQVASYSEAGIELYTWESVLDEATTMQCRFMHGREFPVAHAIKKFQEVESLENPEDIKSVTPFVNYSGGQLYFGSGDSKTPVAQVTQNVVGQKDKIGGFGESMDTGQLMASGIHAPPLHGHCRSTVIPSFGSPQATGGTSVQVPINAPVPPPTPEKKPKKEILSEIDSLSQDGFSFAGDWLPNLSPDEPPWQDKFKPEDIKSNATVKKPKLDDLIPTIPKVDSDTLKQLIKSPKALQDAIKNISVVKFEGKLYLVDGHEAVLAQKLLGQKATFANLTDLDKPLVPFVPPEVPVPPTSAAHPPPIPPVAPALAPAPPAAPPDVILGQKLAGPGGSNPGGVYMGSDGVKRYIKFYSDPAQAHGEHLANNIYRDLGIAAPHSTVFEHEGKLAYASQIEEGKELQHAGLSVASAKEIMRGFVADVLVGNWDAPGLHLDNMLVKADDSIVRIDNGGAFLMRAKNGRKPDAALNAITEWEKFFDPSVNPAYAKIAKFAGIESPADMRDLVISQIKEIGRLQDANGGWAGYVEKMSPGLNQADKQKIILMLTHRSSLLEGKAYELSLPQPPKPKKLPLGPEISFKPGVKPVAPPIDHDNLAIRKFEELPKRKVPTDGDYKWTPDGSDHYSYKKIADKAQALDDEQKSSIKKFTMPDVHYTEVREAQKRGDENSRYGMMGSKIESAFHSDQAPRVSGRVFRGLKELDRAVVDKMMTQDVLPFGMTSSTSRSPEVARGFMDRFNGSSHRVFMVIHQKSGIPIESISDLGNEYEVLMSKNTKLRVLSRYRAEQHDATLIIECEEIEGEATVAEPKPKRRSRKPAGT